MHKKLLIFVCAAILAIAMPVIAFAAENGSASGGDGTAAVGSGQSASATETPTDGIHGGDIYRMSPTVEGLVRYGVSGYDVRNGESVYFHADIELAEGVEIDKFEYTEDKAKNFEDGEYLKVQSYKIESSQFDEQGGIITLAWYAGVENEGLMCRIFVEHGDGTTQETKAGVDKDGKISVKMDKLSTITFALTKEKFDGPLGEADLTSASVAVKDNKAVSPKTGGIL